MKSAATYGGDPRHHHTDLEELRERVAKLQARVAELEERNRWLHRRADRMAEALRKLNPNAIALVPWDVDQGNPP